MGFPPFQPTQKPSGSTHPPDLQTDIPLSRSNTNFLGKHFKQGRQLKTAIKLFYLQVRGIPLVVPTTLIIFWISFSLQYLVTISSSLAIHTNHMYFYQAFHPPQDPKSWSRQCLPQFTLIQFTKGLTYLLFFLI